MLQPDIKRVCVGILGTNCYVVSLPGRDDCAIVDPGDEAERIRKAAAGKRIAAILLTHAHFDHIGAVDALMTPDTGLFVHETDADRLTDPVKNVSWLVNSDITVKAAPTRLLKDGDTFEAAGLTFTVLHTPGHTPGSVCYLCGPVIFTGDTLMSMGCGRTDFPDGSDEQMEQSLARLSPLTEKYMMLGGHG